MSAIAFRVSRKGSHLTRDTVVRGGNAVRDRVSAFQWRDVVQHPDRGFLQVMKNDAFLQHFF